MNTDSTTATSHIEVIDEFLENYGQFVSTPVVDFALDLRSVIAELEAELAQVTTPVHAA